MIVMQGKQTLAAHRFSLFSDLRQIARAGLHFESKKT
jgi:hypothetical protein